MSTERVYELIDLLVADEIRPQEWEDLEFHATGTPALWREIAVAQYERDRFNRALNDAAHGADLIELPGMDALPGSEPASVDSTYRLRQWNQWAGWALAAVLVLAFAVRFSTPTDGNGTVHRPAGGAANIMPSEALNQYLTVGRENGSVMGEMPRKVLLQTRPLTEGSGYEVIFIRQIVERTEVPDLYQYAGQDELGQPTLVRLEQPIRRGM